MDKKEKIEAEVLESNKEIDNTIKEEKELVEEVSNVKLDNKESNNEEIKEQEIKKEEKEIKEDKRVFQQKTQKKKGKKYIVLAIILTFILILATLVSTIFALLNFNNNTILSGIHVNNILLEGLTEDEAIELLNEKFAEEKKREIILKINGETYSITPEQIEVEYNVSKAVEDAYSIGRNGNIFENNFAIIYSMLEENNLEVEIKYNEELFNNLLKGIDAKIPNAMVDNSYYIEDDELIITRGIDGIVVDTESAKQAILDNIKSGEYKELDIKTKFEKCPAIDIEKIYSEVKTDPQNATYKTEPFEIIPHKNGIAFDLETAKQIISEEKEEYIIKLIITEPEIMTNEIGEEAFPNLLSSFSTKYDETNVSRSKNVKIAMSKLNGVVVMPGEVFSYNKTVGKRTREEGYEDANGFAGGKVVPMLAGGICQVSSTLYDAVLYANLNIVERYNHMFQATYVEPGKDATVVYGSLDFKFENTRSYPIMIKTHASGGLAEIKIFGIREAIEYDIEIISDVLSYTPYKVVYQDDPTLAPGQEKVSQWGLQGCKSITYRIVKHNGQEVSKEVLSTDTYDPLNKIIRRGPTKTQTPTVDTSTTPETQTPEIQKPEVTPEKPVIPEPEKPVEEPEKPQVPETPEESAKPEKEPETPKEETPEEPVKPEEPEQQEKPEISEEPEDSETSNNET